MEMTNTGNKLHASRYIIPAQVDVDCYMLLHGYSGAIELVDSKLYRLLCEEISPDISSLPDSMMQSLTKRGFLTTKTDNEEYEFVRRFAKALHKKDTMLMSSYTFVVSYNCNFSCPYCFERNSNTERLRKYTMSKDAVDKAFMHIDRLQSLKARKTNYITLFGGEPLLKENKEIVSYIVGKGLRRGLRFKAITNGFDLEHFVDLLGKDKISQLQITIDGMANMHNAKRPLSSGGPTFDRIIDNIPLGLERGVVVSIRFNTDKGNVEEMAKLKELFDKRGYTNYSNFKMESARLVNYDDSLSVEEKRRFLTQREFVAAHSSNRELFQCHDYETYNNIYHAIFNNEPLSYRSVFCSSQIGGYIFDPLYRIFPCWDLVGNEKFQIGDYSKEKIEWMVERKNMWDNMDVMDYSQCAHCKCALLCGGGCVAHNFTAHDCTQMMEIVRYAAKKAYHSINLLNKK